MMKSKTDYFNARKCLGLGRDILKETPGVKYMPIRKRAKKSTVLYPTVTTPSLPTEGGSYTPRKWTVLLHLLPAGAAPPPTAPQRPSCTSLCAADAHDARRRPVPGAAPPSLGSSKDNTAGSQEPGRCSGAQKTSPTSVSESLAPCPTQTPAAGRLPPPAPWTQPKTWRASWSLAATSWQRPQVPRRAPAANPTRHVHG